MAWAAVPGPSRWPGSDAQCGDHVLVGREAALPGDGAGDDAAAQVRPPSRLRLQRDGRLLGVRAEAGAGPMRVFGKADDNLVAPRPHAVVAGQLANRPAADRRFYGSACIPLIPPRFRTFPTVDLIRLNSCVSLPNAILSPKATLGSHVTLRTACWSG